MQAYKRTAHESVRRISLLYKNVRRIASLALKRLTISSDIDGASSFTFLIMASRQFLFSVPINLWQVICLCQWP